MTTSVTEKIYDALAFQLGRMSPDLELPGTDLRYINTLTPARILRQPQIPAPHDDQGYCFLDPFAEKAAPTGSSQWWKTLSLVIRVDYDDSTGRRKFDWWRDLALLIGIFDQLQDADGHSTANNVILRGQYWGGQMDGLPNTYITLGIDIEYAQSIVNPEAIA